MTTMRNIANIRGRRVNATRTWLLARSAELRERVRRVDAHLRHEPAALPGETGDFAIAVEPDEVLGRIRKATLDELYFIRVALRRVQQDISGICEECDAEIEAGCLESAPSTTRCACCAREH
jgi:RNA polymerase-binding transcription factor DksA